MTRLHSAGPTPLGHKTSTQLNHNASDLYKDLQLAIEYVPLRSIKNYHRSARTHSKQQIAQIAASFQAFGVVSPLVIDTSGELIAGHGRLAAAKLLKHASVPVVRIDHLDDAQKRALRIADNQLAALAGWDKGLLALEFNDLLAADLKLDLIFDLGITGFSPPEIDKLVDNTAEQKGSEDDLVPELDLKQAPVSRLGDLWLLGDHRIVCGDARDAATYTVLLGQERATMSISDAPYNLKIEGMVSKSGKHAEFCMGVGELTSNQFEALINGFLTHARTNTIPGGIHFAFMDWRHMQEMLAAGHSAGLELKNLCVWNKSSAGMGGGYRSQHELVFMWKDPSAPHINNVQLGKFGRNRTNVWDFPGAAGLRKELELHPTPKPVSLIKEAIKDCSNRNDIVLDCFSGSGTTILAAATTGRRARVIELDPHYVDVAITRWQTWSGLAATHAGSSLSYAQMTEERARPEAQPGSAIALLDPSCRGPSSAVPPSPQVRVRQRPPASAHV